MKIDERKKSRKDPRSSENKYLGLAYMLQNPIMAFDLGSYLCIFNILVLACKNNISWLSLN